MDPVLMDPLAASCATLLRELAAALDDGAPRRYIASTLYKAAAILTDPEIRRLYASDGVERRVFPFRATELQTTCRWDTMDGSRKVPLDGE